jgi:hypothetical protein
MMRIPRSANSGYTSDPGGNVRPLILLLACRDGSPNADGPHVSDSAVHEPGATPLDPGELQVSTWDLPLAGFARLDGPGGSLVLGVERRGTSLCPDCSGIDPDECPEVCERDVIVAMHEGGGTEDWLEVFPASYDDSVAFVTAAGMPDGSALVAFDQCDRTTCGFGLPRDSCTTWLARFGPGGEQLGPLRHLHAGWVGLTRLFAHPDRPEVLALQAASDRRASAQVAVLAPTGDLLLPWTPVGGPQSDGEHAVPSPDGFLVSLDDLAPSRAPTGPCPESCDCGVDWSGSDPDAGVGLYPVTAAGVGARQTQITGRAEITAVAIGSAEPVVAAVTSEHEMLLDGAGADASFADASYMWVGALAIEEGAAAVFHDLDGQLTVVGSRGGASFTRSLTEEGIGISQTTLSSPGRLEALVLGPRDVWQWLTVTWAP